MGSRKSKQPTAQGGRYAIHPSASPRVAEPSPAYATVAIHTVVTATEAARNFSDLVNRASYQGETFVIERGGRALCQLGPLDARRCTGADLLTLLSSLPRPHEEFLDAVEAVSRDQRPVEKSPWEK
ncbi:MAG: type II toxin-antitoxin system Phd/YefM family antitoxin [Candidatus Binatia bacterium]